MPGKVAGRAERSRTRRRLKTLFADGAYQDALEEAEGFFRRHPHDVAARHHYALALFKLERFREAADVLWPQARRGRLPAKSLALLGMVLRRSGRTDDAVAVFDRALAVDSRLASVWHEKALAMYEKGHLKEAAHDLKRLIELRPDAAWVRHNLGAVYVALGDWDAALAQFAACAALELGNIEDYMRLAARIGEAKAYRKVSYQMHRYKNVIGILGGDMRRMALAESPDCDSPDGVSPDVESPPVGSVQEMAKAVEDLYYSLASFLADMTSDGGQCESTDLSAVIDSVLAEARGEFGEVTVEKAFDPRVPEMFCNRGQLKDVILNVVLNAVEAMSEGGRLRIRTRALASNLVEITVVDTGQGIPADILPRVFDFGFSTKKHGSGMGLSLARGTICRYGGTIDISSEPGKGTRVEMVLPATPETGTSAGDIALKIPMFDDAVGLMLEEGEDRPSTT